MSEKVENLYKKYSVDLPLEEIQAIVSKYEGSVRIKIDLLFDTIKLNSDNGQAGLDLKEACQWVDAAQNMLCVLFQMLVAMDSTENQGLTNDFISKVQKNLEKLKIQ